MSDYKDITIINELDNDFIDWGVKAINADKIWNYTKGKGVKVAVIDSGVDMDHPDLKDRIKETVNMFDKSTRDIEDVYGHGSHIAGLIAGKKTGVAPESELYISNVLNSDGLGTMANILDGITFAINYEVDILCMSLGTGRKLPNIVSSRLELAHQKGITIVCAVGNNGKQKIENPASCDFVISVGGVDRDLSRAEFSNYGFDMDVVAPAVDILSTYKDGKYALMSGTSSATPLVAGGLALIKAYHRDKGVELSPDDMKNLLKNINNKKSRHLGHGLFNLSKILKI